MGSAAQPGQADAVAQPGQADAVAQPGHTDAEADGVPAGEQAKDAVGAEPAAVPSPGLERLRSTPTRPEE
jgi:hypothetical protein